MYSQVQFPQLTKKLFMLALISALMLVALSSVAQAAGNLDPTYGFKGLVATDFGGGDDDFANDSAIQPDGKVVVVGTVGASDHSVYTFGLARYDTTGSLDSSFGSRGQVTINFGTPQADAYCEPYAVAIQPDGRIVVVGRAYLPDSVIVLARFNPDGSLDSRFGSGGKVISDIPGSANDLVIQPDGKIVVGGSNISSTLLLRYDGDGSLDEGFGNNGLAPGATGGVVYALALQSNGQIIASGNMGADILLACYNSDGQLAAEFGGKGGIVITDFGNTIDHAYGAVAQPDGRIVVSGSMDGEFMLARYESDGFLDETFGVRGRVLTDFGAGAEAALDVDRAPDGKIVAAGYSNDRVAVARYNTNGSLDSSFGLGGKMALVHGGTGSAAAALNIQADGKIITVGLTGNADGIDFGLARFRATAPAPYDYDGDGKSDISVFSPSDGTWLINRSSDDTLLQQQWGQNGDTPLSGDFDGDARTDLTVWRNGVFYVLRSSSGTLQAAQWGQAGDDPRVSADYDNDGKTDFTVWRKGTQAQPQSTFYILRSSNNALQAIPWGNNEDVALTGDFDADGRSDAVVYRLTNATFYVRLSSTGSLLTKQLGYAELDRITIGDFDGDGKADFAAYNFIGRQGRWSIVQSSDGMLATHLFGTPANVIVPADYDGDGKTDLAVFYSPDGPQGKATWSVQQSSDNAVRTLQWGFGSDYPVPFSQVR